VVVSRELRMTVQRPRVGVVADSLVSGSRPGARDRVIPCAARNAGHVGL